MNRVKFKIGDMVKIIKLVNPHGVEIPSELNIIGKSGRIISIEDDYPDFYEGRFCYHYALDIYHSYTFASLELKLVSYCDYYDEV